MVELVITGEKLTPRLDELDETIEFMDPTWIGALCHPRLTSHPRQCLLTTGATTDLMLVSRSGVIRHVWNSPRYVCLFVGMLGEEKAPDSHQQLGGA
jgi:hypothetical protein